MLIEIATQYTQREILSTQSLSKVKLSNTSYNPPTDEAKQPRVKKKNKNKVVQSTSQEDSKIDTDSNEDTNQESGMKMDVLSFSSLRIEFLFLNTIKKLRPFLSSLFNINYIFTCIISYNVS